MIAVMQPYFFPYLGYFQLINAVDQFVFYDDVSFIKRGWINRNFLLVNGRANLFTLPIEDMSQNRLINETRIADLTRFRSKLVKKLEQSYRKAPNFEPAIELVLNVLTVEHEFVADIAISSIVSIADYLGMDVQFNRSSVDYPGSSFKGTQRLIDICQRAGTKTYVNSEGGKELYNPEDFSSEGITLKFFRPNLVPYPQSCSTFVPGLSVIDAIMFNDRNELNRLASLGETIN